MGSMPSPGDSELHALLLPRGVPRIVVDGYVAATAVMRLHDWQRRCLEGTDVLGGESAVVCVDTAGGKSTIAEVAVLVRLFAEGRHCLYVLPYLANVSEKADLLKQCVAAHNAAAGRADRCAVRDSGDVRDVRGVRLDHGPALTICTPEAACGLLDRLALDLLDRAEVRTKGGRRRAGEPQQTTTRRRQGGALGALGCVVLDEVHMVGDESRGVVVEKLGARLRALDDREAARGAARGEVDKKRLQIVALSATLPNSAVVARWLEAKLHVARHRPVALRRSVEVWRTEADRDRRLGALVAETATTGDQALFFFAAPRTAVAQALRLAAAAAPDGRHRERAALAREVLGDCGGRDVPADLVTLLQTEANCGVAYHVGPLAAKVRKHVEAAYRAGLLKILCCTSTLAAGVNLPCARVIVAAVKSATPQKGAFTFPRDPVQREQMAGRAGRGGAFGAQTAHFVLLNVGGAGAGAGDGTAIIHGQKGPSPKPVSSSSSSRQDGDAVPEEGAADSALLPAARSQLTELQSVARLLLEHVVGLEASAKARGEPASVVVGDDGGAPLEPRRALAARTNSHAARNDDDNDDDNNGAPTPRPCAAACDAVSAGALHLCVQRTLRWAEIQGEEGPAARAALTQTCNAATDYLVVTECLHRLPTTTKTPSPPPRWGATFAATKYGRALVAAGGQVSALQAKLVFDEVERARRVHCGGCFEDYQVALCAAPLPGTAGFGLADVLVLVGGDANRCWRAMRTLLTRCGADAARFFEAAFGGGGGGAAAALPPPARASHHAPRPLDMEQFEHELDLWCKTPARVPVLSEAQIFELIRAGKWARSQQERAFRLRRLWLALLTDALLTPAHGRRVVTPKPLAPRDLAALCGLDPDRGPPALDRLARRAVQSARSVAAFVSRLRWDEMRAAVDGHVEALRTAYAAYADKPTRWPPKLRALRRVTTGDAALARTLVAKAIRSATDVAALAISDLEDPLRASEPWRVVLPARPSEGSSTSTTTGRFIWIDSAFNATPTLALVLASGTLATPAEHAAADAAAAKRLAKILKSRATDFARKAAHEVDDDARRVARRVRRRAKMMTTMATMTTSSSSRPSKKTAGRGNDNDDAQQRSSSSSDDDQGDNAACSLSSDEDDDEDDDGNGAFFMVGDATAATANTTFATFEAFDASVVVGRRQSSKGGGGPRDDNDDNDDNDEDAGPPPSKRAATDRPKRSFGSIASDTYATSRSCGDSPATAACDLSPRAIEKRSRLRAAYSSSSTNHYPSPDATSMEAIFGSIGGCASVGLAVRLRSPPRFLAPSRKAAWELLACRFVPDDGNPRGGVIGGGGGDDDDGWAWNAPQQRPRPSKRVLCGAAVALDDDDGSDDDDDDDHHHEENDDDDSSPRRDEDGGAAVMMIRGPARRRRFAAYVSLMPVPPTWPWESRASRDEDAGRLRPEAPSRAALPCACVARVIGMVLGGTTTLACKGAVDGSARIVCDAATFRLVSKRWYVAARRACVVALRAHGALARFEALFADPSATVVCADAAAVATIFRAAGAPFTRCAVADPRVARQLVTQGFGGGGTVSDEALKIAAGAEDDDLEVVGAAARVCSSSSSSPGTSRERDGSSPPLLFGGGLKKKERVATARRAFRALRLMERRFRPLLESPRAGRALAAFEEVEMRLVAPVAEMMHSGLEVDALRLRRCCDDVRLVLDDLRTVGLDMLGVENLDAHRAVNAKLGLRAAKECGTETREQLEQCVARPATLDGAAAPADRRAVEWAAHAARLVLDYRSLAPLYERLKNLLAAATPHPSIHPPKPKHAMLVIPKCVRCRVQTASTASGRLTFSLPNLQTIERRPVHFRRLDRPSLWDELQRGHTLSPAGDRVFALISTVSEATPLGSVAHAVAVRVLDRAVGDPMPGDTRGQSCADYWADARARGYAWPRLAPEDLQTIPQVALRIDGRQLAWPAHMVYRYDAKPRWPPVAAVASAPTPFGAEVEVHPRSFFRARRGTRWLSADYAQNELRVACALSDDSRLRETLFASDPFARVAEVLCPNVDEPRSVAKAACYGILFGQSVRAVAHKIGISIDDASRAMDIFRKNFPNLERFRADVAAQTRDAGFVETIRGKRHWLPLIGSTDRKKRSRAERQALSTVVQGSAADICKAAMIAAHAAFGQLPRTERPRLLMQLHDELIYEVPLGADSDASLERAAILLREAMCADTENLVDVPHLVRFHVGDCWADLRPYELPDPAFPTMDLG